MWPSRRPSRGRPRARRPRRNDMLKVGWLAEGLRIFWVAWDRPTWTGTELRVLFVLWFWFCSEVLFLLAGGRMEAMGVLNNTNILKLGLFGDEVCCIPARQRG